MKKGFHIFHHQFQLKISFMLVYVFILFFFLQIVAYSFFFNDLKEWHSKIDMKNLNLFCEITRLLPKQRCQSHTKFVSHQPHNYQFIYCEDKYQMNGPQKIKSKKVCFTTIRYMYDTDTNKYK